MKIITVISEHKKAKAFWKQNGGKFIKAAAERPKRGYKRVMAIVDRGHGPETRHIDIKA